MPHRKRTKKRPVCKVPRTANGKFKKWTGAVKRKNKNCRVKAAWKTKAAKTRRLHRVKKHLKAKRRVSKPIAKTYTRGACRTAAQKTIAVIRKKKYASVAAVKRDVTRMLGKNSKFARGRVARSRKGVSKKSRKGKKKGRKYAKKRPYKRIPYGTLIQSGLMPQQLRLNAARGVPDAIPTGLLSGSELTSLGWRAPSKESTADEAIESLYPQAPAQRRDARRKDTPTVSLDYGLDQTTRWAGDKKIAELERQIPYMEKYKMGGDRITNSPGLVEYGESIGIEMTPAEKVQNWISQISPSSPASLQSTFRKRMSRASPRGHRSGKRYERT